MFKKFLGLLVIFVIIFTMVMSVNAYTWPWHCFQTPQTTVETTEEVTQETTIEVTETIEVTPEITSTFEPTAEVTEEATPEITIEATPTIETTEEVTPGITPTVEEFPNTGETSPYAFYLIGISILLSVLFVIFRKKLGLVHQKK